MKKVFVLIKALLVVIVFVDMYQAFEASFGGATFLMHFKNALVMFGVYLVVDVIKDFVKKE